MRMTPSFLRAAKWAAIVVAAFLPWSAALVQARDNPQSGSPPSSRRDYSAAALFNQANALSRAGRTGWAILDYERARLIAPTDPAIAANLRLVRSRAGLPDLPVGPGRAIFGSLPANAMAWLGSLGLILVGSALVLRALHRGWRPGFRVMIASGALLVGAAVGSAWATLPSLSEGVIVARNVAAHIAPAGSGAVSFRFHEGETVKWDGVSHGFALVRNLAGQSGWVPREAVKRVVPGGA